MKTLTYTLTHGKHKRITFHCNRYKWLCVRMCMCLCQTIDAASKLRTPTDYYIHINLQNKAQFQPLKPLFFSVYSFLFVFSFHFRMLFLSHFVFWLLVVGYWLLVFLFFQFCLIETSSMAFGPAKKNDC